MPRNRAAPRQQQQSIAKFGKVSKAQSSRLGKSINEKGLGSRDLPQGVAATSVKGRKRTAQALDDVNDDLSQSQPSEPLTPRKKTCTRANVQDTPTKGARSLLQSFSLSSTSLRSPIQQPNQLETPPSSQESEPEPDCHLPNELQDLIDLHSCFLTALSLHFAHNGLLTPADLRTLCPSIARTWRKRSVDVRDLQRLLSIQQSTLEENGPKPPPKIMLTDFGHRRICIELADTTGASLHKRPIDEEVSNTLFRLALLKQWTAFQDTSSKRSAQHFIDNLPLFPIKPDPSLTKLAPLLSKGQSRLSDLKAGAIQAQERGLMTASGNVQSQKEIAKKDPFARSADLKSRIFAKQLHRSTLPAPLSKEQLVRQSALQRVSEIAPVLESLALSAQGHRNDDAEADPWAQVAKHVSFTMPTLVQNIQMSLRNPIASEDAASCVKVMGEILPEWITVREVRGMVGVTIKGKAVGKPWMESKVADALRRL
ncbi:MAG: hypothetical protein OHK93_000369 [Ramalina farinacea]|uniref:DNA replication factor Cdt1 C-terminal domain-containing protein n=1 Tax=Ramalina farinacea TaxID=258253 RepID=A0AA43QEQ7_9LECA|nr:hypothetical protein [Ramalina farinacea]